MPTSTIGFRLALIEPSTDLAYSLNIPAQRWFWTRAAEVGKRVYLRDLMRDLDRYGRTRAPIHPWTREDRTKNKNSVTGKRPYSPMGRATANAPSLLPAGMRSRTYALFTYEVQADGVWFHWKRDSFTGLDWGVVVERHARGFTQKFYRGIGNVPARNVIGLSLAQVQEIRREMDREWARVRSRYAARVPQLATLPVITGAPGILGAAIPPTPAGAIGKRRGSIFGPIGGLVRRAASGLLARTFGRVLGGG